MRDAKDIVVVGAGIAGVSAAVYARRAGLDFSLLEPRLVGGQLYFVEKVDNYPGVGLGTSGKDFAQTLAQTLKDLEIEVLSQEVTALEDTAESILVHAGEFSYTAKGVIIATGASFKTLGIKGEADLMGKGVSYCAVCDGFFFRDKEVAVVGGGNTAVEEAIYLAGICKKVTLIHRRDKLRAVDYLQKQVLSLKNVEVLFNQQVKEVKGSELVEELVLENTSSNKISSLAAQGVFIAIGVKPNTEVFKNTVSTDESGFILTDEVMKTSSDKIWACGDCRKRPLRQLITAASEGAAASLSAFKYLKGHYISA